MTKQPTLTKADLIEEVLKVTELPRKESETIVETIFDSIIEAIQKGEKIEIRGFGSFRTRQAHSFFQTQQGIKRFRE
jgi:integration host factor subunit beta